MTHAVADLTVEASLRSDDQAGISKTIGGILGAVRGRGLSRAKPARDR